MIYVLRLSTLRKHYSLIVTSLVVSKKEVRYDLEYSSLESRIRVLLLKNPIKNNLVFQPSLWYTREGSTLDVLKVCILNTIGGCRVINKRGGYIFVFLVTIFVFHLVDVLELRWDVPSYQIHTNFQSSTSPSPFEVH